MNSSKPRVSILADLYLSDGVTLALDAATANGVSEVTLRGRLKRGESPDEAVRPVVKRPNAFERGEYSVAYDPALRGRMGPGLRALRAALKRLDAEQLAFSRIAALVEDRAAKLSDLRAERRVLIAAAKRASASADLAKAEGGPRLRTAQVRWHGLLDDLASLDRRISSAEADASAIRNELATYRRARDRALARARDLGRSAAEFLPILSDGEPLSGFIAECVSLAASGDVPLS